MTSSRSFTLFYAVACIFLCAGGALASPYCVADLNNDNELDFFDVSEFITLFNADDTGADLNGDGQHNFFDVSLFITEFIGCPDLTDTDLDRIPDFAETDNGIYIDALATGSDPLSNDTDGDGLLDGDEVLGTTEGLMLPGANPTMKDIYVECDWFAGVFEGRFENYRPTAAVEERIVQSFDFGSTPNPYGHPNGIALHLDYGQDALNTGGNQLPGQPVFIEFDDDFNAYKADHFDPRRKGYYHYAIFANRYNSATNRSSGVAEINGDDFMVTMVDYNSTNNMSNTIAHELGHNLGLRHGGFENRNYKINYGSVMSYRYQFSGADTNGDAVPDGILDYSHGQYFMIDERVIDETTGLASFPLDFNNNGTIDFGAYALNLNCRTGWSAACGSDADGRCADSECTPLEDHDDWDSINWNRLNQSFDRLPAREIVDCDNWPGK